jgi:putative ABC transport system permease protein
VILLRLISWPYIRKHLVRSLLTIAGIVLGVAVYVGMHTANQAVFQSFERTVDRIAGSAQLQIMAGETGFDERVLEQIQAVPAVRVAVPVIEAVAGTHLPGQGNLLILGVDMTGDRSLRSYDLESGEEEIIDDPLVFLAQPDSLMVTHEFADRNGLAVNGRVTLTTAAGEQPFVVRGIMRSGGLASAFGGNLAVMDIYAAQQMFQRGRRFDRVDVAVNDGHTVEQVQTALQKELGSGFQVEPPAARGAQFESMLDVYSTAMSILSLFALFIGMFIIYNSFAIAVAQRRSEIGILRALGATRAQIRWLFLVESLVAGIVGSLAGLLLGFVIARSMTTSISSLLEGIYGIAEHTDTVAADPRLMAIAAGIGIFTSIVAAWLPARTAARVDPVRALQKGRSQILTAGENRIRRVAALVLLAAAVVLLASGRLALFYTGYILTIVAALLLTPSAAMWLARAFRPLLRWIRPVEGTLAVDSLLQAPRRTSGVVAALMLALAQVIGIGGMAQSSYDSITDWLNTALNPDLFVAGSQNLSDRSSRFPASLGDDMRRLVGIAEVQQVRSVKITMDERPALLIAVELDSIGARAYLPPVAGDPATMYRDAAEGKGVIISDNYARLHDVRAGMVLDLPAPAGSLRLPILGVIMDWSDQQGSIFVDRSVYQKFWHDDTVNIFRVYLAPGATEAAVTERINDAVGKGRRLFVMTNAEVRKYILDLTNQWLGLTYVQILVAVLVAVLGIVNTLTVSIIDRRRELGVLQAVGGLRRQVRHTIWMEAATIGLIGIALGLVLGAINLYYVLEMTSRDFSGMRLEYVYPFTIGLAIFPTILLAAFVAALWPAEAAVRGSLVEALEYE